MSYKNYIWQFFEKCPSDSSKATCKQCNKLYSLGSPEPKRQTIHGLKLHLSKFHETEHRQYLKRQSEIEEQKLEAKLKRFYSQNSVAAISTDTGSGSTLVQTTIPNTAKAQASKTTKWPDHHEISRRIDKGIMDLIIVDMLPYSLVESEAFRRLNFTDPYAPQKYNYKSEKYFKTSLMPQTYENVTKKLHDLIARCEWISCTFDIWTDPLKTCSLLTLTGHLIVGPKRLKVILGAQVLENDHTGLYIEEKLQEMINKWNISNKLFILLRNKNMVSAIRGQYESLDCMTHTLQLVVKDALFSDEEHERLIQTCKQIVGHFKRSEEASRKLIECQRQCGLPTHSLIQDIEVRWNSTCNMLDRLLELKTAVNLYSLEHGCIETLSPSDWEIMKNLTDVLKLFHEATLDLSFDNACISIAIPLISLLNRKLKTKDENESKVIRNLKIQLQESMNRRFAYVKGHPALITSTLLDPRFKNTYLNSDEIDIATMEIGNHLKTYTDDVSEVVSGGCYSGDSQPTCSSRTASYEKGEGLWDAHDRSTYQLIDISDLDDSDRLSQVKRTIQAYLSQPRLQRNADIYSYWNSSPFPSLRKVALKFLSAPPTSVSSEQLFGAAGQIYSDRKSNWRDENVDKLLFLNYNIRLFNYEY